MGSLVNVCEPNLNIKTYDVEILINNKKNLDIKKCESMVFAIKKGIYIHIL